MISYCSDKLQTTQERVSHTLTEGFFIVIGYSFNGLEELSGSDEEELLGDGEGEAEACTGEGELFRIADQRTEADLDEEGGHPFHGPGCHFDGGAFGELYHRPGNLSAEIAEGESNGSSGVEEWVADNIPGFEDPADLLQSRRGRESAGDLEAFFDRGEAFVRVVTNRLGALV